MPCPDIAHELAGPLHVHEPTGTSRQLWTDLQIAGDTSRTGQTLYRQSQHNTLHSRPVYFNARHCYLLHRTALFRSVYGLAWHCIAGYRSILS